MWPCLDGSSTLPGSTKCESFVIRLPLFSGAAARATYLHELKEAMQERFDCSDILNETGGFYLAAADVELRDGKVLRHQLA